MQPSPEHESWAPSLQTLLSGDKFICDAGYKIVGQV